MKKKIANNVIKKIAKMEGIEEEQVREDIRLAIGRGYNNQKFESKWNSMFGEGHQPTPEEFIMKVSGVLEKKRRVKFY